VKKSCTEAKMYRLFANPMKVCTEFTRFHSAPNLIRWSPLAIDTLSSTWMRVS